MSGTEVSVLLSSFSSIAIKSEHETLQNVSFDFSVACQYFSIEFVHANVLINPQSS